MPNVIETTDAAAGAGTSYSLSSGQTAQGTISFAGDRDWYAISLTKNQSYTVALLGTGTVNLQDPILRLYRANGTQIAFDDDTFGGNNALLTFTASATGIFYLEAAAKNGSDTGQYGIAFGTGAKPIFDESMGGGSIDTDFSWSTPGTPATITYGFRQSAPTYTDNVTIGGVSVNRLASFTQTTNSNVQAAVRAVLKGYEDVAGLTFVDVNPTGLTDNATLLVGNYTNSNDGSSGFADYPGSTAFADKAGDLWLNTTQVLATNVGLGGGGYWVVMHELGHALGLSHPGAYNAGPGVAPTYEANAQFQQDSQQYSIMSYFDDSKTGATFPQWASGLQLYDIYELQKIYGVNTTTRTGADWYGYHRNLADQFDFATNPNAGYAIWDAGGIDTIDASESSAAQKIDLGQGKFSDVNGFKGNLSIAYGAVIENAIGGSGVDTITGNDADNRLEGGAGADTIDGGAGRDTVSYHGSSAGVDVDLSRLGPGPGQYLPRGGDAQGDTLINIENAIGSDQDDRLVGVLIDGHGSELSGGWGNDTIFGSAGDDILHGGGINLVRNGGFELNSDLTAESAGYYLAGSVDSWGIHAGPSQIELFTAASGSTPKTGSYALDLAANPGKMTIAQTVQGVQDGVLYRLAFDARTVSGSGAKVQISFDGVGCGTIAPTSNWKTYFVDVYGNHGSGPDLNRLTFQEVGHSDFNGTQLDNIRLFDASLSDPIRDGNDLLVSNGGNDIAFGDGGNDNFWSNGLPAGPFTQQYDGGAGTDKLTMDWSAATWAVRYMAPETLPIAPAIGAAAAYATGEHFDDRLYFRDVELFDLTGGHGDDALVGGSGNDILHGGDGNDVLTSNGGVDILDGGQGTDKAILDTSGLAGVRIVLADLLGGGTVTLANGTQLTSIESVDLVAGDGDDYLDVRGTVPFAPATPYTTAQPTTFSGHGGNDTLAVDIATSYGASFDGGDGSGDLLIMDWSAAISTIDLINRGTDSAYYASYAWTYTYIDGEGQHFSHDYYFTAGFRNVERFDLTGGQFADKLYGGSGDDVLDGGTGYADTIDGDAGTDTLKVRWAGADVGFGTYGWGGSAAAGYSGTYTAFRSDRNEVRFSNMEKFDLVLGEGNDDIRTGDYDDSVVGNGGDDVFRTGKGADNVDGGTGVDRWQGDKSNATTAIKIDLTVLSQSTYKIGSVTATVTGIEALGGSETDGDRFATGSGNDVIITRSDFYADYIETNGGNDTVTVAGGYADIVMMGDGFDTLKVRWAGADVGFGTYGWGGSAAAGYSGTYTAFRADRNEVRFSGVEKFDLVLGEGNDDIRTGDYDDSVVGNGGDDTFRTGKGADNVDGGAGVDRWQADKSNATDAIVINLTIGAIQSTYKIGGVTAKATGIEALGGSETDGDRFATGSGNDVIITRSDFYADYIETNGGNDTVTVAGGYADIVMMGDGFDTLKVRWAGADVGFGTYGWDGSAAAGYSGTYTAFRADRNEVRFSGVEKFDLVLGNGDDDIRTGDYNDTIVGNDGNDTFRTGKGADNVDGGAGADRWQADNSNAANALVIDLTAASSSYTIGGVAATETSIEALGGSDADGDRFATGSANDVIVTRSDFYADYIDTGDGNDTVTVAGGYADIVLMGSGLDTLKVRWAGSDVGFATYGWSGGAAGGYSGTYSAARSDRNEVRFTGVEKFDLVLGNGDDDIRTGDYNDTIVGNDGNDTFRTGKGADNVNGGAGADRWQADNSNAANALVIDLTAASSSYTIGGVAATETSIEALGGSDADGDRFATGSGNDVIVTRSDFYADYIETNGGNDTVTVAGGYADIVLMGSGLDTLKVRWAGSDVGFATYSWSGDAGGFSGIYSAGRTDRNEVRFAGVEKFDLVLGNGDDDIRTGDYNDTIVGNDGNDTFRTGKGADNVDGGAGADRWQADNSNATTAIVIDLTAASSTYTIGGVAATVTGIEALGGSDADGDRFATGSKADTIVTGSGFYADYIDTGGGNDTVTVAGGYADIVLMGSGLDTLKVRWAGSDVGFATYGWSGGAAGGYSGTYSAARSDRNEVRFTGVEKFDLVLSDLDDNIVTGDYDDTIVGNGGNDTFRTGKGADNLDGGGGADRWQADKSNAATSIIIDLTAASSTYKIGSVKATVTGIEALGGSDADGDRFTTGSKADTIVTGSGFYADYIDTGSGSDNVTVAGGYADIVLMGAGTDTLKVRWAGSDVGFGTLGWGGNASDGYSGTYTAFRSDRNEVRFTGVEKFDLVLGDGGDDIRTGDFDDMISGQGGGDRLDGGGGNDKLWGDGGSDTLFGGDGNDAIDGGTEADTMFGGAGNDTYFVDTSADIVREDSVAGIDDGGLDTVYSSASFTLGSFLERLLLTGNADIDGTGNEQANTLIGNSGINHLFGGDGNDSLDGRAGADVLDGGEGSDTYYADSSDTVHDTGGVGTDQVITTGSFTLSAGSGIENLSARAGTKGNFTLIGDEAGNKIVGNIGNNVLRGLAGNDTLLGGDGDDKLTGGLGRDTMTGGNGGDTFIFAANDSLTSLYDSITDFVTGLDRIDLPTVGGGGLAASAFTAVSVASDNFNSILSSATAAMSGGDKSAVFVAGATNGWLLWNTDSDLHTPEQAVRLLGANSLAAFARTDIV